jgi:hypothetical protein
MNNMWFEEIDFANECPYISWAFYSSNGQGKESGIEILQAKFSGTYTAKADSELISIITDAAVKFWKPKYVIIDLSSIEFKGGQDFENIYDCVEDEDIQTVVVVGEDCRKTMSELYFGKNSSKDIVDNNFFFDDLDKAVEKLISQK